MAASRMRQSSFSLFLGAVLLFGCAARKPGSALKPGFNLFSREQDVELGREAAAQIRQQVSVVNDSQLQSYVRGVGQKLASVPEAQGYPYEFTVINDPSINAFALPGGPVFVHSGTITAADNEAQLAGVMAHEISHVALRHSTNQASKANLLQLPAMIAGGVLGNGSMLSQLAQLGIGFGLNSMLLRYSRDAESQADALGTRIMSQAGYNPIEMARFFEKLEAQGGGRAPQFLSDHPNPGNRVNAVQAEIRTLPQRNYNAGETRQFQQAKSSVSRLPQPSNRGRVAASSNTTNPQRNPGGSFQRYDTQRFTVSYPNGWEAFEDRNSAMVTLAPRNALIRNSRGGTDVGFGTMLSYYFPEGRGDLNSATRELINRLASSNPGLEVAGNSRRVRVDGNTALVTDLRSASPYGGSERNVLLTVSRPDGIFYLIFISPEQNYSELKPIFEEMLRSIDFKS